MEISPLRALIVSAAFASLAGCSGAGSQAPVNQVPLAGGASSSRHAALPALSYAQLSAQHPGVLPAAPKHASRDRSGSWMSPDAKSSKLLYVAAESANDVYVYSYPKGKLMGTLTGFDTPTGICSNKGGDVFILNGNGTTVDVYAHGGTSPLRSLNLPGPPWFNCSVDNKTGDLALGAFDDACGSCGAVIAVFKQAQGTAVTYNPPGQFGLPGCAYDDKGNLFCNSFQSSGQSFGLYELPKGSTQLATISITNSTLLAGSMQWDGKYLAFANGSSGTINQLQVSGSAATLVGTTTLANTGSVWQFWIPNVPPKGKAQATSIIAPTDGSDEYVGYWDYPAGGTATKEITGAPQPDGVAVSIAKT